MPTNTQKKEFIQTVFERIPEGAKNEEIQKQIIDFLLTDTKEGKMYKFRECNEYALSNLQEGTLFCAVPSSFNDPFDCKIGIDIQSSINAKFEKEFEQIGDYLAKFIQLLDGQVKWKDCNIREQTIFKRWKESRKLCQFIESYMHKDISDDVMKAELNTNLDVLIELFDGVLLDDGFSSQMEYSKTVFSNVVTQMTPEQHMQSFDEDVTLTDYARSFGIKDDLDEISLVMKMYEAQRPDQAEKSQKINEDFDRINRELSENVDKQYRVGSLCTDYKNRLMWSHYADGHKGFCIEYDFSKECEAIKDVLVMPVVYSKERIKFPWNVAFADDKDNPKVKLEGAYATLLSLLTKDEVWKYENEWRVIVLGTSGIENIKMPPISCIYIGALCSIENKNKLIKIASSLGIPVKEMVVDRGEYTLHARSFEA